MKKSILNNVFIFILGIALVACGGNSTEETNTDTTTPAKTDTSKADNMNTRKLVESYLKLKDALVSSSVVNAKLAARPLASAAGDDIRMKAEKIQKTDDIEEQRKAFSEISQDLYKQLKESGKAPMPLHWQHCPMAFDNTGASWFSEEKAIKNPYFGDEMLTCGSIKETLAAK